MEDEIKQTFFSFILALDIKNIIATRLKITTDIYLTKICPKCSQIDSEL
jgi:hypothetical protein